MMQDSDGNANPFTMQRLVPAIVLIAVGSIFLLSNFHMLPTHDLWDYWPAIPMVIGVFKLVDAEDARDRTVGGILLCGGAIFLANNLGLIPFNVWDLWPLALVALGVYMLIDRSFGANPVTVPDPEDPREPRVDRGAFRSAGCNWPRGKWRSRKWTRVEAACFSGGKRKISVDDFRAAKYDMVFGGFEIDLRGSQIQGDDAILVLNAVFGGAEVKVPLNWEVVMQGTAAFGGFTDSTEHPNRNTTPNVKQLFVRGAAVFGGIEIKN
jgi:hypothetical protein